MKKVLLIILSLFLFYNMVYAEEYSRIYFTDYGNRIFYKSVTEEDIFLLHRDMVPGKVYNDTLVIENTSDILFKLYFKAEQVDQNELAKELLENIDMTIWFDDEIIYEGTASGLDYYENGINLDNQIYLGEYGENQNSILKTKVKLREEYANIANYELAKVKWNFYVLYDDELLVVNPDTGGESFISRELCMLLVFLLILAIIVYEFSQYRLKKCKVKHIV